MEEEDDNAYLIGNMMGHVDEQQMNSDLQAFAAVHHNNFDINIDQIDPSVFIASEVEERNENEEQEISSSYQPNIDQFNQTVRRFAVPGTPHPNQHPSFVGYQSFGPLCHSTLPFQYAYSTPFVPFSMPGHPSTVGFSQPPYQQMFYGRMLQPELGLPNNVALPDNGNFKVGQSPYQGLPSFDSSLSRFINPIYLDENSNGMNSEISLSTPETSSDNSYNTFKFVETFTDEPISEASNDCIENVSNEKFASGTRFTNNLKLETGKGDGNGIEYELFEDNSSLLPEDEVGTSDVSSPSQSKANSFQLENSTFENSDNLHKVSRLNSNASFTPKSTHARRSMKGRNICQKNNFNSLVFRDKAFRHKNIFSCKDLSGNVVEANKQLATVFQCKLCDYCSNNKSNFRNHLFIHSDERQFACPYCPYKGKQSAGLRAHLKVHSVEKPYKCMYCPYKCKRKQNLIQHLRIHSKFRPFHCQACSYRTTTKQALQKHCCRHLQSNVLELKPEYDEEPILHDKLDSSKVNDVSENNDVDNFTEKLDCDADDALARENLLPCVDCSYECSHKEQMDDHSISHFEDNVVSSTQETNSNIKDTQIKVKSSIFNCPDCDFTSARKCAMGNHVKTHEKNYFCCPLCTFKSRTAGSLRLHLNSHSRSRKPKSLLKCNYCVFDTFNPDVFVSHVKEHKINFTSQRSKADLESKAIDNFYQCPYCAYDCLIFSTFKLHIANHSENDFRKFKRTLKKKNVERPSAESLPSSSATLNVSLKDNQELEISSFAKPLLEKVSLNTLNVNKKQNGRSLIKCRSARASRCAKRARLRILRHNTTESASNFPFLRKLAANNENQSYSCSQSSLDNAENKSPVSKKCISLKRKHNRDQIFSTKSKLPNGILKLSHLDQGDDSQNRIKLLKSKVRSRTTGYINSTPEPMKHIICAMQTVQLQDVKNGETSYDQKSYFENDYFLKPNIKPSSNEQSNTNGYISEAANIKNSSYGLSDSLLQFNNSAVDDVFNENKIVLTTGWESKYKSYCESQALKSSNDTQGQISNKEFKFLKLDQNFQITLGGQKTNLKAETIHEHSLAGNSHFGGYQMEPSSAHVMAFSDNANNYDCGQFNLEIESPKGDGKDSGMHVTNNDDLKTNFCDQTLANIVSNDSKFQKDCDPLAETIPAISEELKKTTCVLFNVSKDDHYPEKDSFNVISKHLNDLQHAESNNEDIISKENSFSFVHPANASDFESSCCQGNYKFADESNNDHCKSPETVEVNNQKSGEALEESNYDMEKGFNLSEKLHFVEINQLEKLSMAHEERLDVIEKYEACNSCKPNSTVNKERNNSEANESNCQCSSHKNNSSEQNFIINKQKSEECSMHIAHSEFIDGINVSKGESISFLESGAPLLERCLTTGYNPYCESAIHNTSSTNILNMADVNVEKPHNNLCYAEDMESKSFLEFDGYCIRLDEKTSCTCGSSYEDPDRDSSKINACSLTSDVYNSIVNKEKSLYSPKEASILAVSTSFSNSPQANHNGIDSAQPVIHSISHEELMPSAVHQPYFDAEMGFLANSFKDESLVATKCTSQNPLIQPSEDCQYINREQFADYSVCDTDSQSRESVKLIENHKSCSKVYENAEFNVNNILKTNTNYGSPLQGNGIAYDGSYLKPVIVVSSEETVQACQNNCSFQLNEHEGQSLNAIVKMPQNSSSFVIQSCNESSAKNISKISAPKISIIKFLKVGENNLLGKLAASRGNSLVINTLKGSKTYKLNISTFPSTSSTKIITSEPVEGSKNVKCLPNSNSDFIKFKKCPQLIIPKLDSSNIMESTDKSEELSDCFQTVSKIGTTITLNSEKTLKSVDCMKDCTKANDLSHDCVAPKPSNNLIVDINSVSDNFNDSIGIQPEGLNDCQPSISEISYVSSKYFCHICNRTFSRKSSFSNHCKSHKKSIFKCSLCTFTCKQKQIFFEHQRTEHEGKRHYNCKKCDFSSTRKCTLITHSKIHKNFFNCKVCPFSSKSKLSLDEHYFTHKNEYECSLCDFVCQSTKDLYEHNSISHKKQHKCSECSFKAHTVKKVNEHKSLAHTKVLIKCHSCNYETNSALFLKFHMKKHLKDNIFLTCKECKYVANSKLDLYNHSSSHFTEQDYKCVFCDDIIANNSELKDHLFKIHSIQTLNSQN